MANAEQQVTLQSARELVEELSLGLTPPGVALVGLECELHVRRSAQPEGIVELDDLRRMLDPHLPLPGGSAVTFEPGGQVELSSPPAHGVAHAIAGLQQDLDTIEASLAAEGVELLAAGLDPLRAPQRLVHAPRYDAMEAYFDRHGPHGRLMMTRTASLQVNINSGLTEHDAERRWHLAHQIGPMLVAAFANSPLHRGKATGWRSTRMANWLAMDPSRTAPPRNSSRLCYVDYALNARVMLIRPNLETFIPQTESLTFADWVQHGHPLGWPNKDDLQYHLSTLFPPVRPRGWLELRYLDALPAPWWSVAAAVTVALLDDEAASQVAERATRCSGGLWLQAARQGLAHPVLHTAARRCFAAALEASGRLGLSSTTIAACLDFSERYVETGRCPADDWQTG